MSSVRHVLAESKLLRAESRAEPRADSRADTRADGRADTSALLWLRADTSDREELSRWELRE